jgi:hypothetical protein
MYVHEGKRKFYVTIREVRDDNTLGESESFSVYDSKINMDRTEFTRFLIAKTNQTSKRGKK